MGISTVLTIILERIERVEYQVDKMEKACSSMLDRMDERLGLLEVSFSSINSNVTTIKKANESSTMFTQVAQSKVNI